MLMVYRHFKGEHIDVSYPTLVVRYEDLLFDTERTVRSICECAGGTSKGPFKQLDTSSKADHKGFNKVVRMRVRL